MRIGIFGFFQLRTMQYLRKYTEILDDIGIEYDVIHWNRDEKDIEPYFKGRHIVYNYKMRTEQPFIGKLRGFVQYAAFMRRIIRNNRYDKIIVLTTQTMVPLFDLLIRKYKYQYVYGFYDITKENKSKIYKMLVKNAIDKSYITTISSFGFLDILKIHLSEKIVIAHNTQTICRRSEYKCTVSSKSPIRITYWGIIRQVDFNRKICDIFGNDERFILTFHGGGCQSELQEYCKSKAYNNVFFTGQYKRDDIPGFSEDTDILNCLYENDDEMRPAMQVKFYDAIRFRKPMIVHSGSFIAEYSKKACGICAVEVDDAVSDIIYSWYMRLQPDKVDKDYQIYEDNIYEDDCTFKRKLISFINE